MNEEIENYKSNESSWRSQIEDSQALIDSLRDQLRGLAEENKALKNSPKVEYVERTVERVDQAAVSELRERLDEAQEEKARYQQWTAKLEAEVDSKEDRINQLEGELETNAQSHYAEIESLNKALTERNTIIDRILDLQKDQDKELVSLKDKLTAAERSIADGQQSTRVESQRVEQLQGERDRYMMDLQQAEKRYKQLQSELAEQQEKVQEFYANQLRDKDRKIKSQQEEVEGLQAKHRRQLDNVAKESEKQLEVQRATIMKELGKSESSKEVFWNKEREMLKSQVESLSAKLKEQEALVARLKTEDTGNQQKDAELENLRYVNTSLKTEISSTKSSLNELKAQNADLFSRLEDKNTEIKELVVFKEKYDSSKEEHSRLRSELNRRDEELVQFNSELVTLKDRIKNLLKKIDEVSNEKLFYEAKVERLETRLMDVLYNEEKSRPVFNDSQQFKDDIQSKLTRAEDSEQEAR